MGVKISVAIPFLCGASRHLDIIENRMIQATRGIVFRFVVAPPHEEKKREVKGEEKGYL